MSADASSQSPGPGMDQAPGDPSGLQSFAFCYGYIRALIQAVDQMA